jgi:hypothetical protein
VTRLRMNDKLPNMSGNVLAALKHWEGGEALLDRVQNDRPVENRRDFREEAVGLWGRGRVIKHINNETDC